MPLLTQKVEAALAQGDAEAARRYVERVPIDATQPTAINAWLKCYHLTRQSAAAAEMLRRLLAGEVPPRLAPQYRARLSVAEAFAGNASAADEARRQARDELLAVRSAGDTSLPFADDLVIVFAFLKDKAAVDAQAAALRDEIATDALVGPLLETTIAAARAQLGDTETAIAMLKDLLNKPGEDAITPALLRLDPLWDPLRSDPRVSGARAGEAMRQPGL